MPLPLGCYLLGVLDESAWDQFIPDAESALLTASHALTGRTPYELICGRAPPPDFDATPADQLEADSFIEQRRQVRQDALDAVHYTQSRMAFYYDRKHRPVKLHDYTFVRLARKSGSLGPTIQCQACRSSARSRWVHSQYDAE